MRLLITTQAVDRDDPILGFFHGWLLEFAKHFERIDVICLREGVHVLPTNVYVHSLGKEHGENRLKYITRFYGYVWQLRNTNDVVFSHMNPHYIVLAGWFWFLKNKRMYFWRNHARMDFRTKVAAYFAKRVFYTSPFACTKIFLHAIQMPVGIDTNLFTPQESIQRKDNTVLLLGRISPVKKPEIFIEASKQLEHFEMHVYGDESPGQSKYRINLIEQGVGHTIFHSAIPNYATPAIYSEFDMYVNLTPEGSMDKTVLEAAACGALPIVANRSFEGILPDVCLLSESTPRALALHIERFGVMSQDVKQTYRNEMRQSVIQKHSLQKLAAELVTFFSA